MKVFKFGGASVKNAESVRNVARIIQDHGHNLGVVVVSAMGKTTNRLEQVVNALYGGGTPIILFNALINEHKQLATELFGHLPPHLADQIDNFATEAEWLLEEGPIHPFDQTYDQIVPMGEMLSTTIVAAYLADQGHSVQWLDARDVIKTDSTFREARIDWVLTSKACQRTILPSVLRGEVLITQGFVGVTDDNMTTTLGREGSDFTAAIIAHCLDAAEVVIWKDVPGVLNADPRRFADTVLLPELTYHDAIELTWLGTSVIHPRTVKPLQNKNIPLRVKSFVSPTDAGTVIWGNAKPQTTPSIIVKDGQALVSLSPRDYSFVAEAHLQEIFQALNALRIRINVMQNSALSLSLCTDASEEKLASLREKLGADYHIRWNMGLQLTAIRPFNPEVIERTVAGHELLLDQRTRTTAQFVTRPQND